MLSRFKFNILPTDFIVIHKCLNLCFKLDASYYNNTFLPRIKKRFMKFKFTLKFIFVKVNKLCFKCHYNSKMFEKGILLFQFGLYLMEFRIRITLGVLVLPFI